MWFQLKLAHCPRSLAASLAALPSMSLIPFAPLKLVRCPTRSSLLQFPIAVPGFLDALAALGTSRRKVNSHQRFATLPSVSEIPFLDSRERLRLVDWNCASVDSEILP